MAQGCGEVSRFVPCRDRCAGGRGEVGGEDMKDPVLVVAMFYEKAMMMKQENKDSIIKVVLIALVVCLVIIIGGILLSYCIADKVGASPDCLNNRGLFGDSWGGVNALVSALAFAGVIVTLYLQNRDLNLQREEMRLQREEFARENETFKYQRFENLYYNMLNLQQKIVEGLRYEYKKSHSSHTYSNGKRNVERSFVTDEAVGRDVFRYLFRDESFSYESDGNENYIRNGYHEFIHVIGLKDYNNTWIPTLFDHYFRHLYKIVQFVDDQGFEFQEAYKYVSLLRETLSRYEMVWLYYHVLTSEDLSFKRLIEKYSLLQGLRHTMLSRSKEANGFYVKHGITIDELKKKEFTGTDFEYFLTNNPKDVYKYQISAFWDEQDIQKGKKYYALWDEFLQDKTDSK